jgi:hypothetical protein
MRVMTQCCRCCHTDFSDSGYPTHLTRYSKEVGLNCSSGFASSRPIISARLALRAARASAPSVTGTASSVEVALSRRCRIASTAYLTLSLLGDTVNANASAAISLACRLGSTLRAEIGVVRLARGERCADMESSVRRVRQSKAITLKQTNLHRGKRRKQVVSNDEHCRLCRLNSAVGVQYASSLHRRNTTPPRRGEHRLAHPSLCWQRPGLLTHQSVTATGRQNSSRQSGAELERNLALHFTRTLRSWHLFATPRHVQTLCQRQGELRAGARSGLCTRALTHALLHCIFQISAAALTLCSRGQCPLPTLRLHLRGHDMCPPL